MAWHSLGVIAPNQLDWQSFNSATIGTELFRVRQTWVGDWPGSGYLLISDVYADGGRYSFRKVGSDKEPRILTIPVPPALSEAGITIRYLSVKLNTYARTFAGANWTVEIDEWY